MSDTNSGAGRLVVRVEANTANFDAGMRRTDATTQQTIDRLRGHLSKADGSFDRFGAGAKKATDALGGLDASLGPLSGSMGRFGGAAAVATAAALAVVAALKGIAEAGDKTNQTLAQLGAATGSLTAAQAAYEGLFKLSQQTGVAVAESAAAFARFAVAAREVGATNEQVLKLVAGIQKAGIVAGSSTQETQSAVTQLGQALASGVLQGDELRSLLESMPQLAQSLAKELGVGIGQLRQMGAEGKLTATVVLPALLRATESIGKQFDALPVSMSRAKGVLLAATEDFGSRLDKIAKLSETFAKFMMQGAAALKSAGEYVSPDDQAQLAALQARAAQLRAGIADSERRSTSGLLGRLSAGALGVNVEASRAELASVEAQIAYSLNRTAAMKDDARAEEARRNTAAANTAMATQNRADAASVASFMEANDKKTKIEADYQRKLREIDRLAGRSAVTEGMVGGAGFVPPVGAGMTDSQREAAILAATKERDDALKGLNRTEGEHASAVQNVISKLQGEVAVRQAALPALLAGTSAQGDYNTALKVQEALQQAGIPLAGKRTEQQQREAETIAALVREREALNAAEAAAPEMRNQKDQIALLEKELSLLGETEQVRNRELAMFRERQKIEREFPGLADKTKQAMIEQAGVAADIAAKIDQQKRSMDAIGDAVGRAFDNLGQSLSDAFLTGQKAAINFGNIARSIAGSLAAEFAKLAIINPIVNSIGLGGSLRPTLGAALGGGGGGGGLLGGLGNLSGLSNLFGGDSLFGGLGSAFSGFMATPIIGGLGPATTAALGGMGGTFGPATFGQLQSTGMLGFGGSGATLGGLLGGAGAGFGAGMLLNSLLGGNQLGGTIGSGLGGLAGAAIGSIIPGVGTLIGGLLGGALGGAGGGLFGPGPKHHGWSYTVDGNTSDGMLDIKWPAIDEVAQQQFAQEQQQIAQVNAYLKANKIRAHGYSIVGGNNDPNIIDDADTFNQGFGRFTFSAQGNDLLNNVLEGRSFADPAKLQETVSFVTDTLSRLLDPLGEDAGSAFKQQLDALNKSYDDAAEKLRELGMAEDDLSAARAEAIAKVWQDVTKIQTDQVAGLNIRSLQAGGYTGQAALVAFDASTTQQFQALIDQFKAWYGDAYAQNAAYQATLGLLTSTIADERAAIVAQQSEAARQAGSTLDLRMLQAQTGGGQQYDLAVQAESARREIDAFAASLRAMNVSAEDAAALMVRLEETQAAERAAIIERYGEQAAAALQAVNAAGGGIRAWLNNLKGSPAGGLSPEAQFTNAQQAFGADLALARGGNADALGRITSTADTLLNAGRAMYASGAEFQLLQRFIGSSLEGLPATQGYDQQLLAALQALGGSVNVTVSLDVLRVITEQINALPEADRARLVQTAEVIRTVSERIGRLLTASEVTALQANEMVTRTVEEALGRSLTEAERASLVGGGTVARTVEQALGRSLTPAERAMLLDSGDVLRNVQQLLGRDLTAAERDGLVPGGDVLRNIEQLLGRTLSDAEQASLVQSAEVLRNVQQLLGRNLTEAERAALVGSGDVVRTIQQAIGRDLTEDERTALVYGGSVLRSITQAIGRDLSADERGGLVLAGQVIRSIEQQLGRALTTDERASIVAGGTFLRSVLQHLATGGDAVVEGGSVTRDVTQNVETTETIEISRSVDDKIAAALAGQAVVLNAQLDQLKAVNDTQTLQAATLYAQFADQQAQIEQLKAIIASTTKTADNTKLIADVVGGRDPGGGNGGELGSGNSGGLGGSGGSGGDAGVEGGGYALGAAFAGGNVVPFATGGIPELVDRPTYRPLALFGEAGPEAIVPLSRDRRGRLGVSGDAGMGKQVVAAVDRNTQATATGDLALREEMRAVRAELAEVKAALRRAVAVPARPGRVV